MSRRVCAAERLGSITRMTETQLSLPEQLDAIGAQLDWVRDYL